MTSSAPNQAELLQRLVDESEIRQLTARYARAIDRMDWELLRSCYHPDAYDDHGVYRGDIDGFIAYLHTSLPRHTATSHVLGNQVIELEGDVAWVETYCQALHRLPAEGDLPERDRTAIVRYCDRLEKRGGEWRIAHRVVAYEPSRTDPVTQDVEFSEHHVRGIRSHDDVSYDRSR